ncbi:hypothetical protein M409DRAFT_22363 [Zasmidium cellare ATCC 36951]|uniref:Ecp2 effector protein domain-containing protein n=1 Tax=Zasmidium cellare ATCC 36951 TaxID=1080233 RepID=A0A6A6CMW3_ZASCE|nr:uncharacterized protein M409DRAFT_22363 [Zasmidium cellare ATCC 36951]KAF2167558.1 hypothetical protein M409DRAFT_22363 [Zasmidium cellare ATCC 36951]
MKYEILASLFLASISYAAPALERRGCAADASWGNDWQETGLHRRQVLYSASNSPICNGIGADGADHMLQAGNVWGGAVSTCAALNRNQQNYWDPDQHSYVIDSSEVWGIGGDDVAQCMIQQFQKAWGDHCCRTA